MTNASCTQLYNLQTLDWDAELKQIIGIPRAILPEVHPAGIFTATHFPLHIANNHIINRIAEEHAVSIANVATRIILDKPKVAGVIVGVRLGLSDHREDNARVSNLQFDGLDLERIENIVTRSNDLYRIIGDCGDKYRN
jgi:diketogulonate reductase-like aldo/keto reductase